MVTAREELVSHLTEGSTQVFNEDAFRHLLTRESVRAIRYQDFFTVCLLRPDGREDWELSEEAERAVSQKIPEFIRATDLVGQLSSSIAVILLHTAGSDALRVAERIRTNLEQVAFQEARGGRRQHLTVSVGKVSFPDDGQDDTALLARAMAVLEQAALRGGNQVSDGAEPVD